MIQATAPTTAPTTDVRDIVVSNNTAHDNATLGIQGQNSVLVIGNTAFGHLASGAVVDHRQLRPLPVARRRDRLP